MSLNLWLVPSSVMGWIILIPASLLIFTKNITTISTQMKVNGMATSLSNEYIFKCIFDWPTIHLGKLQRMHMSTWHAWESAYLKSSSHHWMDQMLLKMVWCMMRNYTAQCNLFGTYSAQGYTCRKLHAHDATRLLKRRNHSKTNIAFSTIASWEQSHMHTQWSHQSS